MRVDNRIRQLLVTLTMSIVVALLAPAASAQPAPEAAGTASYVVRSGDTAWAIAQRFNVRLSDLVAANKLGASGVVRVGQNLVIPGTIFSVPPRLPSDLRIATKLALIPYFDAASKATGVPRDLIMAVAYTESSWRSGVISPDGAVGLGQLLPSTARWVAANLARNSRLSEHVDRENVLMSAYFLDWLLDRFTGNRALALASYFEGASYVQKNGPSRAGKRYANLILLRMPLFAAA